MNRPATSCPPADTVDNLGAVWPRTAAVDVSEPVRPDRPGGDNEGVPEEVETGGCRLRAHRALDGRRRSGARRGLPAADRAGGRATADASCPRRSASACLARLLEDAVAACGADHEVLEAVNLALPDGLLIPDIAVVDGSAAAKAGTTVDCSGVVLVVEIVSPSTRITDVRTKPSLCAAAGIPHYWRLELDPAPGLVLSERHGAGYTETGTALAGAVTRISAPVPFDVDPAVLRL
ncbi:Uma2 family endonuclease [Kitasatospora sp. NPDC088346]|uniref:Uma2 family endonuclease n=1 Tax=Kitasatospora sp. NPDC088346 TaxID=3364073 RepID=UPI00382EC7BC